MLETIRSLQVIRIFDPHFISIRFRRIRISVQGFGMNLPIPIRFVGILLPPSFAMLSQSHFKTPELHREAVAIFHRRKRYGWALSRHICRIKPTQTSSILCPAFAPPQLPNVHIIGVRARQVGRSLEFWRRVIAIWASFKSTQLSVALQRKFRGPNWPARVWEARHERAGDVSFCYIYNALNMGSTVALLELD